MRNAMRYAVQAGCFGLFAVFVGYLSASPSYQYRDATESVVKLSLSHAADRVEPCVVLTPEEVAKLAPNMRQELRCERERLPVVVELDVDGERLLQIVAPPSGLWDDGPASIYETINIAPGPHTISVRLRDTARASGWDHNKTESVVLEAGRYFTITFAAENGGFSFR